MHGNRLARFHSVEEYESEGKKLIDFTAHYFLHQLTHSIQSFNPKKDPENVYIDFQDSRVIDHSAIQAIDKLAERYQKVGKTLHLNAFK